MSLLNLIRPKWKHSDAEIRLKEVKSMSEHNETILIEIARDDSDVNVRKAALQKIHSLAGLNQVAEVEADETLVAVIDNKRSELIQKELKKEEDLPVAESVFEKIRLAKTYEGVALTAKLSAIRKKAIEEISKEQVFVKIANEDGDLEIARLAFSKITKNSAIQQILNSSIHAEIRKEASAVVKQSIEAENKKAIDKIEENKRSILVDSLKRLVEVTDILNKKIEVEALIEESRKLFDGVESPKKNEAESLVENLMTKVKSAEEKEEQRKAAAQELEGLHHDLKAECEKIEAYINDHGDEELEAVLEKITSQWEDVSREHGSVDGFAEFQARFDKAVNRLKNSISDKAEESLDKQRKAERRQEIFEQIKLLRDIEDLYSVKKQLKSVEASWSSLGNVGDESREIAHQYEEIKTRLENKIKTFEEEKYQKIESNRKELEALCEQIENLEENQEDFKEITKTLRQANTKWKDLVGEDKGLYQKLWQRFQSATARFKEMKEWELWHNEKEKETLVEEARKLKEESDESTLFNAVMALKEKWNSVGYITNEANETLWGEFKAICDELLERCTEYLEKLKVEKEENYKAKVEICERIAELAGTEGNWKQMTDEVKELQDKWKTIGFVPKEKINEIFEKYKKACDDFYDKRRDFLKSEEDKREHNYDLKSALCEKVDQVVEKINSEEGFSWEGLSSEIKKLQKNWKEIGPVPKAKSNEIWNEFRGKCDLFFEKKREYYKQLDDERVANYEAKVAICEELEGLEVNPGNPEILNAIKTCQERWATIGHVPKDKADEIFERYIKVLDDFLEEEIKVNEDKAQEIHGKISKKEELIQKAQELSESTDWNATSEEYKVLQSEWKKIGRIGRNDQELWKEFRRHCDTFFDRRRDQFEILQQNRMNNLNKKILFCEEAERLSEKEADEDVLREVKLLRQNWRGVGQVPQRDSDKIWKRFNKACDIIFEKCREAELLPDSSRH